MMPDTLQELCFSLDHKAASVSGHRLRVKVLGYSTDTRSLKKGDVFIALHGEQFDGHDFLDVAARRKAVAAIVSKQWFARNGWEAPLQFIVVEDTLKAYGEIATMHRKSFKGPVIAVAGSNGKTTTKELIADLLGPNHVVLRTEGNLNNLIGVPAMLLRLDATHTAAVIEIGTNTPGEIARLCEILEPTHGIITNIGREHLELLGSLEGVAKEEGALFDYLAAHGGTAFVNADDPHLAGLARGRTPKLASVRYSLRRAADVRGRRGALDERGAPSLSISLARTPDPSPIEVQLRTPGIHTAGNALAAAAVALTLGVAAGDVKAGLEAFEPKIYPGGYARLAPMTAACGARILNDTYNANPDSALAALATLAAMKVERGGMRIAVLADMKELGKSSAAEHRALGTELSGMPKIEQVIFHGAEMQRAYRAMLRGGFKRRPLFYADKQELAEALLALVDEHDVVLVKGSRGMAMETVVARLVAGE